MPGYCSNMLWGLVFIKIWFCPTLKIGAQCSVFKGKCSELSFYILVIPKILAGEELSADEGRRLSKDMNAIAADNGHMDNHIGDMMTNDVNTGKKASQTDRPRSNTDVPLGANHKLLSESVNALKNFKDCDNTGKISSSSNANRLDGPTRHLTRRSASDVSSNKKLEEYHKWKVSGCKGDPPAKLKISQ